MYVYIYCRLTIVAINWTFISFCWWYVAFFVLDFFYFICLVKCYIYLWCWVRYSTTAFHLSNVVLKFDFDFSLKLLSKCFIVMFHHDLPVTYDTDWVQKARPIYNYLNIRRFLIPGVKFLFRYTRGMQVICDCQFVVKIIPPSPTCIPHSCPSLKNPWIE